MKSFLLAGTFLGTMATFAVAADQKSLAYGMGPVSGYTSWWAGAGTWQENDGSLYSGNFFAFGGDSRVNVWMAPGVSLQGDVQGEASSNGFEDCCYSQDHRVIGVIGGHAAWRSMSNLFGVFGGVAGSSVFDEEGAVLQPFIGFEAQAYLNQITLYGQVGTSWNADTSSYGMDQVFFRGILRYFLTPNDKLQAEIGIAKGHFSGGGSGEPFTNTNWGLLYEHQFGGSPFSAFAELASFTNNNDASTYRSSENQFMLGARVHFGSGSLLQQDRQGASLDLPTGTVFRPLAWGYYNY